MSRFAMIFSISGICVFPWRSSRNTISCSTISASGTKTAVWRSSFRNARAWPARSMPWKAAEKRIVVQANSPRGQFYALSTLLQILSFHGDSGRMPVFSLRDAAGDRLPGICLSGAERSRSRLAELRRLLLKLALLKFNHFALPAACWPGTNIPHRSIARKGSVGRTGMALLAARARKMGMEIFLLPADAPAPAGQGSGPTGAELIPTDRAGSGSRESDKKTQSAAWFEDFLNRCRLGRARGERMLVWGDLFADHPEWIRKIPRDVLVLQKEPRHGDGPIFSETRSCLSKNTMSRRCFARPSASRDRFIPAMRRSMARISAAFAAGQSGKTGRGHADRLRAAGETAACRKRAPCSISRPAACSGAAGRPCPGPSAAGRWAGMNPTCSASILSWRRWITSCPIPTASIFSKIPCLPPFLRQGDPREIEAHYRKAALYLKKRKDRPQ